MPIYEYVCLSCEKHLEAVQKFSDPPLSTCPECGGELKKLISASSFVLKGSGWYVTDYPSAERKKAMDAEKKTPEKKTPEKKKKEDKKGKKTETATV
ncbi:MAG TPA: zinc ribbon domain-containing protein [Nitrospirae bacterium]|nr:zinc ribbon domain-containing protein [Nitrospirota bacterium]HDY71599.1 zinc ribbon domain-containing protein [Nitrospirota bacterium]